MIIMINGAFGVGKTSVTKLLVSTIPHSMVFDPEEIGFMLRDIVPDDVRQPHERTDDFQDLGLWRELTVQVAQSIKHTYARHLIVPMTIINQDYFRYIRQGFESIDTDTYHFCLSADENILYDRLRKRGEEDGNWCVQQVEKCVATLRDSIFREHIDTNTLPIDAVAERILTRVRARHDGSM